jgi:hypothetical protein
LASARDEGRRGKRNATGDLDIDHALRLSMGDMLITVEDALTGWTTLDRKGYSTCSDCCFVKRDERNNHIQ